MEQKRHIEWIDSLKGLAIILVVLGHNTGGENDAYHFFYTFHMPLFFLISGFLFSMKPPLEYLKRSFRHLMVPYIAFLGCYALYQIISSNFIPSLAEPHFIRNIFYGGYRLTGSLAVFWFVGVLWMAQNLYNLIVRLHPSRWWLLLLICSSYATILLKRPWVMCINVVPLVLSYIWLGNILREEMPRMEAFSKRFSGFISGRLRFIIPAMIILTVFALLFVFRDSLYLNIKCNRLGLPGVSYIASVAGAIAAAFVAAWLHRNGGARLLGYLGRSSMTVMYLHMPVKFYMVCAIWHPDFPLAGFILGLALPLAIHELFRRHSVPRRLFLGA